MWENVGFLLCYFVSCLIYYYVGIIVWFYLIFCIFILVYYEGDGDDVIVFLLYGYLFWLCSNCCLLRNFFCEWMRNDEWWWRNDDVDEWVMDGRVGGVVVIGWRINDVGVMVVWYCMVNCWVDDGVGCG